jgi:hypothetical protein
MKEYVAKCKDALLVHVDVELIFFLLKHNGKSDNTATTLLLFLSERQTHLPFLTQH